MEIRFFCDYVKYNWKLVVHLLLRTKRFGVNNQWWSSFGDSIFGWPTRRIIISIIKVRPIIENYKMIKFRAAGCHFLSENTVKKLGWYRYWESSKEIKNK